MSLEKEDKNCRVKKVKEKDATEPTLPSAQHMKRKGKMDRIH